MSTNKLRDPPVKAGDHIQVMVELEGGSVMYGTVQVVKWVDSSGVPYVRYRFGKVDKHINRWVIAEHGKPTYAIGSIAT